MSENGRDVKRMRLESDGGAAGSSNGDGGKEADQLPPGITTTEAAKKQKCFVGSLDQGTTSSRFIIFNRHADPVASHQIEFQNHYPHPGYAKYISTMLVRP